MILHPQIPLLRGPLTGEAGCGNASRRSPPRSLAPSACSPPSRCASHPAASSTCLILHPQSPWGLGLPRACTGRCEDRVGTGPPRTSASRSCRLQCRSNVSLKRNPSALNPQPSTLNLCVYRGRPNPKYQALRGWVYHGRAPSSSSQFLPDEFFGLCIMSGTVSLTLRISLSPLLPLSLYWSLSLSLSGVRTVSGRARLGREQKSFHRPALNRAGRSCRSAAATAPSTVNPQRSTPKPEP